MVNKIKREVKMKKSIILSLVLLSGISTPMCKVIEESNQNTVITVDDSDKEKEYLKQQKEAIEKEIRLNDTSVKSIKYAGREVKRSYREFIKSDLEILTENDNATVLIEDIELVDFQLNKIPYEVISENGVHKDESNIAFYLFGPQKDFRNQDVALVFDNGKVLDLTQNDKVKKSLLNRTLSKVVINDSEFEAKVVAKANDVLKIEIDNNNELTYMVSFEIKESLNPVWSVSFLVLLGFVVYLLKFKK